MTACRKVFTPARLHHFLHKNKPSQTFIAHNGLHRFILFLAAAFVPVCPHKNFRLTEHLYSFMMFTKGMGSSTE
jgi:hypothetical protein